MRRFPATLILMTLAALVVGGCSGPEPLTTSYDANDNRTAYQTKPIPLGRYSAGGLSGGKSVRLIGQAVCRGNACTPQQAYLIFTVRDVTNAGSDLFMGDRSLSLEINGERFSWANDPLWESANDTSVDGEVARLPLTVQQLSRIARADDVQGALGSMRFSLPYSQREPLRLLINRLNQQPPT